MSLLAADLSKLGGANSFELGPQKAEIPQHSISHVSSSLAVHDRSRGTLLITSQQTVL